MAGDRSVDREMLISEVVRLHPRARTVLVKYGMGCLGCMGALDETVEGGAKMHGISVDRLVEELNVVIGREEGAA